MTISKEAIDAAARAMCDDGCNWDNKLPGHRKTMWLDRAEIALKTALPFLALRPAPSQSDEERAREIWDRSTKCHCVTCTEVGIKLLAPALAEATLAGAAAEREAIEGLTATLEDEQAAHQDTLRLLAAKDRKIAALREALEGYMSGSAAIEEILWGEMADNKTMTITVTLGVHRRARAALAGSGAVDPAEAMRAKCEDVAGTHSHRGVMDYDLGYIDGRKDAADAVAALKGNGEGL